MATKLKRSVEKIILLVSPGNGLWRAIFGRAPTQLEIANFLGIPKSSISQWRDGTEVSAQTVTRILDSLRKNVTDFCDDPEGVASRLNAKPIHQRPATPDFGWLRNVPIAFQLNLENDEAHLYQAANAVGLQVDECQIILDQTIYDRDLLFPGMGYLDGEYIRTAFNELEGIWYFWMRRRDYFLRSVLRVRYRLPIHGRRAIRCKLNIPKLGTVSPDMTPEAFAMLNENRQSRDLHHYWEYDGFVAVREARRFWTFEKRDAVRRDYISFISGSAKKTAPAFWLNDDRTNQIMDVRAQGARRADRWSNVDTLNGKYLTVDNDDAQSIVSDELVMQRIIVRRSSNSAADETTMRNLMHFCPAIIRSEGDLGSADVSPSEFQQLKAYLSSRT